MPVYTVCAGSNRDGARSGRQADSMTTPTRNTTTTATLAGDPAIIAPLETLETRFEALEAEMAQPDVAADYKRLEALSRQRASLEPTVLSFRRYKKTLEDLRQARELVDTGDEEMAGLAEEEAEELSATAQNLEYELRLALTPRDPLDDRDIIVEIRAGAGGDEAALFAGDLFRMYTRYAQARGWATDVMNTNETGGGGIKEVTFGVQGASAYAHLKHESGVHRVQRVPETESQGRIHTSTATVAVLPVAEEVDVELNMSDVRVDVFHAGGAGGQNVNKVATAIRMTHTPTGIVVTCQDERSQLQNRTKAIAILRSRLLEIETQRQEQELASTRRSQVGTGDRSEKIRTYNFPQNRVTDHRIGLTLHALEKLTGGELDPLLDALRQAEQERLLAEAVS